MAPPEPTLTHSEMHRYARSFAKKIAQRRPGKYTTLAGASQRVGKLFIDYLRNGRGASAIGSYSPRARSGLPISRYVAGHRERKTT
jgi:bifunctional non-homologous end joining protein LigD